MIPIGSRIPKGGRLIATASGAGKGLAKDRKNGRFVRPDAATTAPNPYGKSLAGLGFLNGGG
jgi:hypothetical protein